MKKTVLSAAIITSSIVAGVAGAAAIGELTTFTAGSTISAAQMNGNFESVKQAVNETDTALNALSSQVSELAAGTNAASCDAGMSAVGNLCVDNAEGIIADFGACIEYGADCTGLQYSISDEGTGAGSNNVSWFQAAAACTAAGKRLPTNYEWTTASLSGQASLVGFDAGNAEWVQDWITPANAINVDQVTVMNRGYQGSLGGVNYAGTTKSVLTDTAPSTVVPAIAYGFRCVKDL